MVGYGMMGLLASVLLSTGAVAQDYSREGSRSQLEGLGVRERVMFINKNFYRLYSADFDNAKELTAWACEVARHNGWAEEEAKAQLGSGVVTYLSGDYNNVLPKYFRSLHLFDSLGDKAGIAGINNEMAVFYHKQKDYDKSFHCLDVAEAAAREAGDLVQLGTSLGHRGAMLMVRGMYKEASPFVKQVMEIRTQTRDSVGLGYVYLDLSELASHEGDIDLAMRYIDQSTIIRTAIGDLRGVAENIATKGLVYKQGGRYSDAIPYFLEGIERGTKIGYMDFVRQVLADVVDSYEAMGDYRAAFRYKEQFDTLEDSLFNLDRTKVIADMQARYDSEKKNQQIAMLDRDNELKSATIERNYLLIGGLLATMGLLLAVFYLWRNRNRQRQEAVIQEQKIRLREAQIGAVIESQEIERKRFATDLHDGMGQLIAGLQMNIQALRHPPSLEKRDHLFETAEQTLNEVHDEIRNIAFNLMPPVLLKEGLVPAVAEMVRKINQTGKVKAHLSAFGLPERFGPVVETSLYRVIQEFLSNIIKYSAATKVNISFTGYDTDVNLTIEDDGMGFDLQMFMNHEGNGWRNVQSRINLIKGSIEIDTEPGRQNTTVIITVPLEKVSVSTEQQAVQNT
jgi:two-component system NarL family sensor kinase